MGKKRKPTPGNQGTKSTPRSPSSKPEIRSLVIQMDDKNMRWALVLALIGAVLQLAPWGLSLLGFAMNPALGKAVLGASMLMFLSAIVILWKLHRVAAICLLILACVFSFFVSRQLSPPVSADNVEQYLNAWLASSGASVRKVSERDAADDKFQIIASPPYLGLPILIRCPRQESIEFIQSEVLFQPPEPILRRLALLPEIQRRELSQRLKDEILRKGGSMGFRSLDDNNSMTLLIRQPIEGLTRDKIMRSIDELETTARLLFSILVEEEQKAGNP